jgi:hypothetical protein
MNPEKINVGTEGAVRGLRNEKMGLLDTRKKQALLF